MSKTVALNEVHHKPLVMKEPVLLVLLILAISSLSDSSVLGKQFTKITNFSCGTVQYSSCP